jgi:lipopolysaccharide transport system permease protein
MSILANEQSTIKNTSGTTVMANEEWTEVIQPQGRLLDLRWRELWRYRDLVLMFVRRDFVSNYKQTILGPIWFFLQPLLTSFTYLIIFGRAAGLAPGNIPPMVFYLSGITIWNYFSECLTKTATVFKDNSQVFGKVYFPRLTMPVSIIISNLVRFGIQISLFAVIWAYYVFTDPRVQPNIYLLLIPFLVVIMGIMALGLGMIISAMTTKYKDLIFLLTFGIQLMMFATPVIIPLEKIPAHYQWIIRANPVTSIVEIFRYAFTGVGKIDWPLLAYSCSFAVIILILGTIVFNRVERSFTDTV